MAGISCLRGADSDSDINYPGGHKKHPTGQEPKHFAKINSENREDIETNCKLIYSFLCRAADMLAGE